jgi:hypothetical protein
MVKMAKPRLMQEATTKQMIWQDQTKSAKNVFMKGLCTGLKNHYGKGT